MKEYTTAEIFEELWKRIEYDANVSEELASESNELQARIDKAIEYIEKEVEDMPENGCSIRLNKILDILKGSKKD